VTRYRLARHGIYQRRDDPIKVIAEHGAPLIRAAVVSAFHKFRASVPVAAMTADIKRRDFIAAAGHVNVPALQQDLRGAFNSIASVHRAGAELGATQITTAKQRRAALSKALAFDAANDEPDSFAFNLYSQDVLDDLRDYQDVFISGLTEDVRQAVFEAITEGVADGIDPADVADSIRGLIGLNERQAVAVENYRDNLENGTASYSDDAIDGMVDAYIDSSLAYRAGMIAQTESNRAANLGLQHSYQQAVDNGVFPADAVKKFWLLNMDERTCEICRGIADANADGIGIAESFDSDDGPVDIPPIHPNCRCSLEMRTNLDMVPRRAA
jgi:hypothetical protein